MNKHKHYNAIRAYADGWEIEYFTSYNKWERVNDPSFLPTRQYRVIPDNEGWLPWYGGESPFPERCKVGVKFTDGSVGERRASLVGWADPKLIAYKLVEEAQKPKPKVKMWQWVLSASGTAFTTTNFYRDEAEVRETHSRYKIIQRADWTEIEVEDA